MKHQQTPEEKFDMMTKTPVQKLIGRLAVPTIISMLITSIYNMADTFFLGQLGKMSATTGDPSGSAVTTGAVGVCLALMAIIQAVGFTLGMGSGNYISRLLGHKEAQKAEQVASTGFLTAIICGGVITVLGLLFLDPLVRILGATDTILPHAKAYAGFILLGAPYMAAAFVLNNLLRFQGSAFYSMLGLGTGGLLNILLDPLFIFVFRLGTAGAAIATIISQFVSFLILFSFNGRNGNIKVSLRNFTPKWAIYKEILRGGLPSFYRQGLASIATISLNWCANPFGDVAISAMTIVSRIFQFALSALLGFGQGFQPVCGFNYGAQRYDRVMRAYWFCIKVACFGLIGVGALGFLFAPQIVSIFVGNTPDVIAIGSRALRFQCITFPLSGWITINNMLLQTIGKGTKASILALARQGLFFLPLVFCLSAFLGLIGVQVAQPMADVCTFMLAVPMGISVVRELREMQRTAEIRTNDQ